MKKLLLMALVVAVAAVGVQAQITLYDNFDSYALGTIHDQGEDLGGDTRWMVQRNSSLLGDPGWVTVVDNGGDQMLQVINRDLDGMLDTIYLSMSMYSVAIAGEGTIYVRYKATGANDTIMATNDKYPGFDYGGIETGEAGAPSYQRTTNYSEQGAMVFLNAAGGDGDWSLFRARDGSSGNPSPTGVSNYKDVDMGTQADAWTELWIQVDSPNARSKYFICPDDGIPAQVLNPTDGSEWWYHRNQERLNAMVAVLKWFIGSQASEEVVTIESIAIDTAAMTTAHYAGWAPMPSDCSPGDADGDGDVDLDDFVILKNNFGATTGMTCAEGDFDGDGDVDLDDFVLLKNNFGT